MKKSHILAIAVVAVAIMVIMSTATDASTYVSFTEARELSESGNKKKIHVVGTLKKDLDGNILGIEKSPDQLAFKFLMLDENAQEQQVLYPNPMPTDFDKSEQVVVVGAYENDVFLADKILLKCPSKYKEDELNI